MKQNDFTAKFSELHNLVYDLMLDNSTAYGEACACNLVVDAFESAWEALEEFDKLEESIEVKHNIPNHYYKCPNTGVEMNFTFHASSGWGVAFPFEKFWDEKIGINIPFPETPEEYKEAIDTFYSKLKERWE